MLWDSLLEMQLVKIFAGVEFEEDVGEAVGVFLGVAV